MRAELNGVSYSGENFATPPAVFFANDPVGDELQADTLTVEIIAGTGGGGYILTADNKILKDATGKIVLTRADGSEPVGVPSATYGDVITLFNNAGELIAKMYVDGIERTGRDTYKVSAISALGLLIRRTHYGGIYEGVAASSILADIMGTVPYTVGGAIGNELIYGHLPIASARDNLHLLLQALGASLLKDENGDILCDYIDAVSVAALSASEIYLGEGSVAELSHATDVVVVEHGFIKTSYDKEVTLFDNTDGAAVSSKIVAFDNPCYDLSTTGSLSIDTAHANYAVVSGIGTLTGFEYTHTAEEYELSTGANGEQMTVAVRENELINATNSYNLAMRLAGFYGRANSAEISAAVSGIRTGHHITFKNIYNEDAEGYVTEAQVALSVGVDKTQFKIATDYEPGPFGANYDSVLVITSPGTWNVPAGMAGQHVRVIAIGGARGGQAGFDGEAGELFVSAQSGSGGAGGAGGAGGIGFKVKIDELDLTAGSYPVVIGAGGAGGASNGAEGALGGDTSLGSISSADGTEATGYYDIITASTYGGAGDNGISGANGGSRGGNGEDITIAGVTYSGGTGATAPNPSRTLSAAGGGAAAGGNGEDASVWAGYTGIFAKPGDGADATLVPAQQTLGRGGNGGHGGGGGGAGGGTWNSKGAYFPWEDGAGNYYTSAGGSGSSGGQGSDGFVLVYYNA